MSRVHILAYVYPLFRCVRIRTHSVVGITTNPALHATKQVCAILNGKIIVAGGVNEEGDLLDSVEMYDPSTRGWIDLAPLLVPRACCAALPLPTGGMVVLGGALSQEAPRHSCHPSQASPGSSTSHHRSDSVHSFDSRDFDISAEDDPSLANSDECPESSFAELYDVVQDKWCGCQHQICRSAVGLRSFRSLFVLLWLVSETKC